MAELYLKSPAKVNLFFRVLRKRQDGFHEIASLYHTISIFDEITIKPSDRDILHCDDPKIPTGPSNLIWKAAHLFREHAQVDLPISVTLKKNIPVEAGLGGGSSNAASILWGLNHLLGNLLSDIELLKLASAIGSDVPFFLSQGAAYCTGRGERFKEIAALDFGDFYIAKPSFGMSTPKVYQSLDITKLPKRDPVEALQAFKSGKNKAFNDLEISAFEIDSRQKNLCDKLNSSFGKAVMTGSGSAVMCWGEKPSTLDDQCIFYPVKLISRGSNNWY